MPKEFEPISVGLSGLANQGQGMTDEDLKRKLALLLGLRDTSYLNLEGLLKQLGSIIGPPGGHGNGNDIIGGGSGGGCLVGNTQIETPNGFILAEEVKLGTQLIGMDEDGNKIPQTVTHLFSTIQPCVRVTLQDGQYIDASTTHEWILPGVGKVPTTALIDGTPLIPSNRVVGLTDIGEQIVHWWTCEPSHTYFVCGVLHHNAGGGDGVLPVPTPGVNPTNPFTGGGGFGKNPFSPASEPTPY